MTKHIKSLAISSWKKESQEAHKKRDGEKEVSRKKL
jgi:hypothetical protein